MAILKNINFHHRRDCGCYLMVLVRLFYVTLFLAFVTDVHGERCALRAISGGANYTTDSQFETNLKRVFQNLVLHTPQTGFNTSVYGQIPNRIFGLFQCRGDTTVDQCYNCWKWVTNNIKKFCGNSRGCRVWFDLCYLRYENYNFTGQLEDSGPCYYLTPNASNPAVSIAIVAQLWSKLKDEAASAMKRCAFGRILDSLSRIYIYGQAQCTRDISTHYCKTCLSHAINDTKNYSSENYPGYQGLQGLFSNCIVRYETYSFFNLTPLPPSPAKAPAYYTPQSPPAQVHLPLMLIAIILVVVGGFLLILFQCLFGELGRLMPAIFACLFAILRALMSAISVCLFPILRSLKSAISICLFATWRRLKSDIFGRGYKGHGQFQEDALNIQDQSIGHRKVKEDVVTSKMEMSLSATENFHDQDEDVIIQDQAIVTFKMETLVAATKTFHEDNKLGEGGFGPVYKGITEDGKEIAVKKLSLTSRQGRKEFLNEVHLVAKIRHRNVVNILGCCAEGSERLLVYEYLPNRSLDKILLDRNKPLDWPKRYNVIVGVARGLLYLHEDSHLRIIHRDIKASNILLDENMNPKIADFGLARLFPEDVTHVSTGAVAGTYGYMAPEYALHGQLSVKVDVYSYGVLLLELVTGGKNMDYNSSSEMQTLLGWAWASYQERNIVQMFDPAILETCDKEHAFRCIHVGLLCTQADPLLRPSMPAITMMLSPKFVGLPDPTKPAFVLSVNQNINSINSVDELFSGSTSDI